MYDSTGFKISSPDVKFGITTVAFILTVVILHYSGFFDKCIDLNKYTIAPFTPLGVKVIIYMMIYLFELIVAFISSISNNVERFTIAQYMIHDCLTVLQDSIIYLNIPQDQKTISIDPQYGIQIDIIKDKIKDSVQECKTNDYGEEDDQ